MNKTKALLFKRNKLSWTRRPYPSIMHNTFMSIDECVFFLCIYMYGSECIYTYVCIRICVCNGVSTLTRPRANVTSS